METVILILSYLSPDDSHLRLVRAAGDAGLVLGLVHVGASLADVPPATQEIVHVM